MLSPKDSATNGVRSGISVLSEPPRARTVYGE